MAFEITIPSSTDYYNLITDLNEIGAQITGYLNTLNTSIGTKITSGSAASVASLTSSGTVTGKWNLYVTADGAETIRVHNASTDFGISNNAGTKRFRYIESLGRWASSHHIQVPNSPSASDAANRTYVDGAVSGLSATLTSAINGKVNIWGGNVNWAPAANYANTAGSATTATSATSATTAATATNATNAANATNADKVDNRHLKAGLTSNQTLAGGATGSYTITHSMGGIPIIVATAIDDHAASINVSVDTIDANTAMITAKNISDVSETFRINWIAVL
jgi:hypothetical protein